MEQLVINARERLLESTGEENVTGGETETGQISGQDEQAAMDSVHGADARTERADKPTHMFYFVKHHQYELTPKMACKIEQARLETQRRRKEIENLTDTLRQVKIKEKQRIRKDSLKSGEEKRIMYLNHRIRNQRLTSKEKTTLLKLIKELETTRDKAIDAAAEASLMEKNYRADNIRRQISSTRKQHKSIKEYVQNAGYLQNCELHDDADALAKQNNLSALADLSNNEVRFLGCSINSIDIIS
ncbi:hypothetical protein FCM35_KLT09786 [Carex littledalei]|uniref:Uncharacterized protein n=1 Tax=Carex littledalei TaxID=544730 RepID=A0A833RJZ2_9POAL|nr:hypothetical protein FCM35_KLT09786 [Carex littledalei]